MKENNIYQKKFERERTARLEAEKILEDKSREIFSLNEQLKKQNESLEQIVKKRTIQLEKEKNRAIKASTAKGEFLAKMTHEIRTPLNGVIGMSQILEEKYPNDSDINLVINSGKHLLEIVNDILSLSEIESNKMKLNYENYSFKKEISNTLKILEKKSEEKEIKLRTKFQLDQNIVNCDIIKINQILINLVNNAIKFTPEKGTVSVKISLKQNNLYLSVLDSGIGIDPKNKSKLFKSFSQANNNIRREYGGTGLGLSITEKLCSMMNGYIKVKSFQDKGSLFFVKLKVKNSKDNTILSIKKENKTVFNFEKILVVEDNKVNQIVISKFLDLLKITYDFANNGKEALDLLEQKNDYKLIFMDIHMPIMDGITCSKEILSKYKNTPKIVALTANSFKEDIDQYLKIGMSDYLSKPFMKKDLIKVLNKFI